MITSINEFKQSLLPTFLFTDIVGSSKLQQKDEDKMSKKLDILFKQITKIIKNKNAYIIKTIGDAFFIVFENNNSLMNAIESGIKILEEVEFDMRIGICKGDAELKEQKIQGKILNDQFGDSVNIASRMESKVADTNEIAFTNTEKLSETESKEILNMLSDYKLTKIKYVNNCADNKKDKKIRSVRILTDLQTNYCKNIKDLNGIQEVEVYKFKVHK